MKGFDLGGLEFYLQYMYVQVPCENVHVLMRGENVVWLLPFYYFYFKVSSVILFIKKRFIFFKGGCE